MGTNGIVSCFLTHGVECFHYQKVSMCTTVSTQYRHWKERETEKMSYHDRALYDSAFWCAIKMKHTQTNTFYFFQFYVLCILCMFYSRYLVAY